MKALELKPEIYWVGAKDWNLRLFHGYKTQRGSSYNAYLILDDKVVLVDTVKHYLYSEMLSRISSIIEPSKIDYIICNHVEMDHSGSIPMLSKICPKAQILTSPNGEKGLKEHFFNDNLNIKVVTHGEELSIGKRTLKFFHMPMVHWPDSMATYVPEEEILLPNDAFGQHLVADTIFSDEHPDDIVFYEAAKYYANIVYPYGSQVQKVLKDLSSLNIKTIAPSHGLIIRKDINKWIEVYNRWSNNENQGKALIIYDSMWGSTEQLASKIYEVCERQQIPTTIRSLSHSHYSDVIADVLDAKYIFIGSPVLNNELLPTVASFMTYLKGLKPRNKIAFVFGSYGWAPKAIGGLDTILRELKWELPEKPFNVKYVPKENELKELETIVQGLIEKNQDDKKN